MTEQEIKNMQVSTRFVYKNITKVDQLLQIAEEASELSAAAAKYVRVLRGINPSPLSCTQACENVAEEIADVLVTLNVFGAINVNADEMRITIDSRIFQTMAEKTERWAGRLLDAKIRKGGGYHGG